MNADKLLIDLFKNTKSVEVFSKLYNSYANALMRTAMYLTGYNKELAEDILQDVWFIAISNIEEFQGSTTFKTWLTGILFNKFREAERKNKKWIAMPNTYSDERIYYESKDLAIDLKKVMLELPHGFRQILVLHDMEGFTHKEIASILNISDGTSKSQLSRARKAMREKLIGYKN